MIRYKFPVSSKVIYSVIASMILAALSSYAATVQLPVAADATVDEVLPGTNLGNETKLSVQDSSDTGKRPAKKAYLMFDASGLSQIKDIASFTVYYSAKRDRSAGYFLITGDGANDWTEESITWNNAPANRPDVNLDDFVAAEGQTVTPLGSNTGKSYELCEVPFGGDGIDAEKAKQALIQALNTGDRKATIGIRHGGTRFYSIASKESDKPSATLTLVLDE